MDQFNIFVDKSSISEKSIILAFILKHFFYFNIILCRIAFSNVYSLTEEIFVYISYMESIYMCIAMRERDCLTLYSVKYS